MSPLVTAVLTLCLASACEDKAPFAPMPGQACALQVQALAAQWMTENGYFARGYRLAKWGCQRDKRTET
jgi:hypothetical protein